MLAAASQRQRPLALTMGDPAGIGPELAVAAWHLRHERNVPPFVLYADAAVVRAASDGSRYAVEVVDHPSDAPRVFSSALPLIQIPLARAAIAGKPDAHNAPATINSIDRAVADVAAGSASALVTNPIAKAVLYAAGFTSPGHTEYLGLLAKRLWRETSSEPVMMLCSPSLRVVPVTIHVALRDVPTLLRTGGIVHAGRVTADAMRRDFGIEQPRLAVAGLNPHAGEGGAIGCEERDVIEPAIAQLRKEGISVSGPHSADTLFHASARQNYDAAITMYHDQALIPIKTLDFDKGVNVTLGLPFVRTSPDHGTAFDIAGRGIANSESLIAALKLADAIATRRAAAAGVR